MRYFDGKFWFPSALCNAGKTTVNLRDSTNNLISKSTLINIDIMNIAHTPGSAQLNKNK